MILRLMLIAAFLMLADGACARGRTADASVYVDLELVLAVDVSHSMDDHEQLLQRQGYAAALRHRDVINAIRSGPNGRIALAYMEWGEQNFQSITVPWTIISSELDAHKFAASLMARSISRGKRTSISSALHFAAGMITRNGIKSLRQVIDVSGDGPNNNGYPVAAARDATVRQGIIINGLAFVIERPEDMSSFFAISDIDRYYHHCVIGGPGSFMMRVRNKDEFETAIRRKLLQEIAGARLPPQLPLRKAQFKPDASRYDCLIGEKRWDAFQNE